MEVLPKCESCKATESDSVFDFQYDGAELMVTVEVNREWRESRYKPVLSGKNSFPSRAGAWLDGKNFTVAKEQKEFVAPDAFRLVKEKPCFENESVRIELAIAEGKELLLSPPPLGFGAVAEILRGQGNSPLVS